VASLGRHREVGRELPEYGGAAGWVRRAVDYLDRTLPKHGGQAMAHERLWLVVQGDGVPKAEEKAARRTGAKTGAGTVVVARTPIDQSYEPRNVPVKKLGGQ